MKIFRFSDYYIYEEHNQKEQQQISEKNYF